LVYSDTPVRFGVFWHTCLVWCISDTRWGHSVIRVCFSSHFELRLAMHLSTPDSVGEEYTDISRLDRCAPLNIIYVCSTTNTLQRWPNFQRGCSKSLQQHMTSTSMIYVAFKWSVFSRIFCTTLWPTTVGIMLYKCQWKWFEFTYQNECQSELSEWC